MDSLDHPSGSTKMTVSVIVPTFNRADLLRETLQAVLNQTRMPDEVLVVDDGSDDHTKEVVDTFGDKLTCLSKPNSGKADSLNHAIAATTGSHIWIIDDDDLPCPGALEKLTNILAANPEAELAYGRHIRFQQPTPDAAKTFQETGYWDTRPPEYFLIATLEDFFVHQPAMLATRALYERAGPFNTDMVASEDYEMLIRLASEGDTVATDEIIFEQRVHAGVRGQKGHQFKAADRNAKWIEYDQLIFQAVNKRLPLSAYLPRGAEAPDTPESIRLAQIQRASIMGRKKLWSLALTDLEAVAKGRLQSPLSDTELMVLRRALLSKYGCEELTDDEDTLASLDMLAASTPLGRALVRGIGRSLLWHIKTALSAGRLISAVGYTRLYLKLR